MIAQLVLSVLLGAVLLHGWMQLRRSPLVAWMSLIAAVGGLYLVWAPAHTTEIAGLLGIGRGADLIMYLWVCISLNLLLSLHLKVRLQQETITKLARHVALANAFIRTDDADRQGRDAADSTAAPGRRAYVHANARSDRLTSSIRTTG
jgi:small membrane protein